MNNLFYNALRVIYIEGTPYESNIVFLKNFEQSSGSYQFLHKDYLGSIMAISDEAGNMLEQRHFDAWGNLTHLRIGKSKLAVGKASIDVLINASGGLLIDRGYTGHEHYNEVGIIHMNGRLYDPLLRRFLNADENIQDPFNTQIYNRYGYVMNNPLMYNDPDGEFWILLGAVAGAYFTGVKANGSWNPVKWNWGATWGKIAMGAAVGAFTGGVGAAVGSASLAAAATYGINGGLLGGAIAGASGGAIAGAINGFATSVMFGENVIEGTLMGGLSGAAIGGVLGGVSGTIGQMVKNAQAAKIGAPKGTILKDAPIAEGRSAWTLNNTPKTTTVGAVPVKATPVEIGDIGFSVDEYAGTQFVNEQPVPVYKEGPQKIYEGNYASNKGRLGNAETRAQLSEISSELKSRGYTVTNGGGKAPEEYLRPLNGGRKGGSYPDITATHPKYPTLRINTVDVLKDGVTPTARELRNAIRIRTQIQQGEHLLLIPKKVK